MSLLILVFLPRTETSTSAASKGVGCGTNSFGGAGGSGGFQARAVLDSTGVGFADFAPKVTGRPFSWACRHLQVSLCGDVVGPDFDARALASTTNLSICSAISFDNFLT